MKCYLCDGLGEIRVDDYPEGHEMENGECPVCDGKGDVPMTFSDYMWGMRYIVRCTTFLAVIGGWYGFYLLVRAITG